MASVSRWVATNGQVSYVARYRTPDGASRKRAFRLKRDADAFLKEVESTKLAGDYVDRGMSAVTMGAWASKWLETKTSLAASTRARYEDIDCKWIQPRWGTVPLGRVTHEDIQEWLAGLPLAPASVRKVHRNLSQILDFAVRSRRLARNPAEGVDLPRVASKSRRYLTDAQVDVLANAVGDDWRLVVLVLAYTGLRFGELAALRVRDIDLKRRRANILASYSPVNGQMVLSDTKGHQAREVPIPGFLVAELALHLASKSLECLAFTGPRGAILRAQTLQQTVLPKASKLLGVDPPLTPHELRHTAASLAIASGADVKVVQQMLGHKSATMTLDLYGHLFPDRLNTVSDAMDKARTKALKKKTCVHIVSMEPDGPLE